MSAQTFGAKRFVPTPPDKGSFPLDHDGVCKASYTTYMDCLRKNEFANTKCRLESKDYLDCRMNNNLMAKESWKSLGYSDVEAREKEMKPPK